MYVFHNYIVAAMNKRKLNLYATIIYNPCPSPTGMGGDSGANVRAIDLLSFPAVPGKCRACDIT